MSLDDSHDTLPEGGGGASFSKADWARAEKARQKQRAELAKTCKHLIKSEEPAQRRKVDWDKIKEERERLSKAEWDAKIAADGD